jgi:alanine racemase
MPFPADASLPPPRCRAEIDLAALRANVVVCQDLAGPACDLMAVVKADAYGHGLEKVVATLCDSVHWFGVANFREALRARAAAGESAPHLLILSPATPEEIAPLVEHGFSGSVSHPAEVAAYGEAAARLGKKALLHAVADTGMGRMGCPPDQFAGLVGAIRDHPHCVLEGIDSHFPSADEDTDFTLAQIAVFRDLLAGIDTGDARIHLCNSAGLIGFHGKTGFASLARPGLALYGISPLPGEADRLRPVMSLKTKVTLVRRIASGTGISYGRTFVADREMTVATLGVGYGDGYPRHLTDSGAEVLIGGRRCPLLGRVTMDQIVVDVSSVESEVASGDEVVLIGRQGDEEITAVELAEKAGTIPWEILTCITNRVERVYL